jgi:hypothetical protein
LDAVPAQLIDATPDSFGFLVRGVHREVVLRHRNCCTRQIVALESGSAEAGSGGIPFRLVHVTELKVGSVRLGLAAEPGLTQAADLQMLGEMLSRPGPLTRR